MLCPMLNFWREEREKPVQEFRPPDNYRSWFEAGRFVAPGPGCSALFTAIVYTGVNIVL
jgi:hypothetical protein